jgi:hypothetical protein
MRGDCTTRGSFIVFSYRAEMLAILLILCKDQSLKGYLKAYNRTFFLGSPSGCIQYAREY